MRRIDSQIFNTPTGRTYDPSESIARSANRTQEQVYGIMEREHQRQKANEDAFNQIYANIGEIEGKLQQDYAGIQQEMVDATKFMAADHFKSGGRANDPEFVKKYTEMISRIRAGMGNADRIIKQLDQRAKSIADNPYMDYEGKRKAMQEMWDMAQNRDVLISKNPIDFMGIEQKYVNPNLVFKDSWLSLPSSGEVENLFTSDNGDLMSMVITANDLIDPEDAFDEQRRPKIKLTVPRAMEILKNNPMLTEMTDRIRKEKYSNDPYDIGMMRALQDGYMTIAPMTQKTRVKQTKSELDRQKSQTNLDNARAADEYAQISERKLGREKTKELQKNWEPFKAGWDSNDSSVLKNYEKIGKVENIRFTNPRQEFIESNPEMSMKVIDALNSFEDWLKADDETKSKIYKNLNVETPSIWTGWNKDTQSEFNKVKEAFEARYPNTKNISYDVLEGTIQGRQNWRPVDIPVNDINQLEGAFFTLESNRGVNKPFAETTTPKNTPTGTAAKFNPK